MSTPYHAKYFAYELSRQYHPGSLEKLSNSLFDSCVDLNPHQIEAALFALRSPLSKGVVLADEVGLGKTIEAGLLLCQYWAERKRRMLIICPASLRKQWSIELLEKFHLPNKIIDAKIYNQAKKDGKTNPLEVPAIIIMSIHFASRHSVKLRNIPWDLVVIDEAHKLRNVYRTKNKMAQRIKKALDNRQKVLLTATPLQNSLLELYGLASLIDEHIFGDIEAFRNQFMNNRGDFTELQERLRGFCQRTLRSQIIEYIRYTKRRSMTLEYSTTDVEHRLYEDISDFINLEGSYAIPHAQRHLMTLILRKLLASSPYAIAGTLMSMRKRLENMRDGIIEQNGFALDKLIELEEMEDEFLEDIPYDSKGNSSSEAIDPEQLEAEINTLSRFIDRSLALTFDTKSQTLIKSLEIGFEELKKMGALKKAIIFTESRRTQEYLFHLLQKNGYADKVVLFNGTNTDGLSKTIYENWLQYDKNSSRITGSRAVDMRTSIIEHFRERGTILIATEAASEGINLQFCSLLINYDLPWNPQRIEQRIGRCHRYGQLFDVVVINFLNTRNETDCRVFELLTGKFNLFSDVFGASDEILGNLESGIEFEKRIHDIYQKCRSHEEIEHAFKKLRDELDASIQERMEDTRKILLQHFDQDVHSRLKVQLDSAKKQLDRFSLYFWELSKFILSDISQFNDKTLHFDLHKSPMDTVEPGHYQLVSKSKKNISGKFLYRLSHPLGEYVIAAGKAAETRLAQVYFDITNYPQKISCIQSLKGRSGWLSLHLLQIQSFKQEDYIIFTAFTERGRKLDQEVCQNLFYCRAATAPLAQIPDRIQIKIEEHTRINIETKIKESIEMNNSYFNEECDKLDHWSDDMLVGMEKKLRQNKSEIKLLSRQVRLTKDTLEQHKLQIQIKELETQKRQLRENIFDVEDEIMEKRNDLTDKLEKRMIHNSQTEHLFTIRWTVI